MKESLKEKQKKKQRIEISFYFLVQMQTNLAW